MIVVFCLSFVFSCLGDLILSKKTNSALDGFPEEDLGEEIPPLDFVDTSIFNELYYVAFGDSITYGWVNSLQMESPYPETVADILGIGSVYNGGLPAGTLGSNNVGFPCATDGILASTGNIDIISMMLGVNDYASSVPLGNINDKTKDTVYGSLNLIAEHLTTNFPDAFVFFMTPYKCKLTNGTYKDKNSAGYTLENVANAIKHVAARYNIPVLDMFNEGQFELEMYNFGSDGVHPSQEFIKEYTAPQIAEFIKQNYK